MFPNVRPGFFYLGLPMYTFIFCCTCVFGLKHPGVWVITVQTITTFGPSE